MQTENFEVDHAIASGRHFSGIATRILVDYVQDRLGDLGVLALLCDAGEQRPVEVLRDHAAWSSYFQVRRLLEAASPLLVNHGGFEGIGDVETLGEPFAPEIAGTLHSFSSLSEAVLATGGKVGRGIFPILDIKQEVAGPTALRWHRCLVHGFEPYPELCSFIHGLYAHMIRLFGMRMVSATELACQCRGDRECIEDLRWDATDDLSIRLGQERIRREISDRRLELYQQTVDDIVSADDIDRVLERIVRQAAHAIRAPGFVLEVDGLPGGTRLYAEGISRGDGHQLLHSEDPCVSVEVASARRRYGRMLAVDPTSLVRLESASLDSYAHLAATALDAAFAIEEARREAQTAQTLLELSTALAELTSMGEVAAKVARAIPDVINCDCSAVLLVSNGTARVVAHDGYPTRLLTDLENYETPVEPATIQQLCLQTADQPSPFAEAWMSRFGLEAVAAAPVYLDETTAAVLVAAVRHGTGRTLDDVKLADRFSGIAGQTAIAMRNGHLLDQIRHQSLHDPLTDLPNRALILDRAEQMLVRARRNRAPTAALFIDLDGFKEINDTLGHPAGDELLQKVAARLVSAVRANDTVGRLGGDEFIVLTEGGSLDVGAEVAAERILDALREPFQLSSRARPVFISASIGIAAGHRRTAAELLRDADIALYKAKASGKACHRIFAPEMQQEVLARAELGERLADAILNKEFSCSINP